MAGDARLVKRTALGAVMVLSLARPPINALNAGLLAELALALRDAEADETIRAIVLAAEGPQFSAGLDVTELGKVRGAALPPVAHLIEHLAKPVVAALHGNVLGGALELALACHARVAHEDARLSLPEISLGLLPVAGATQRLPRLVGAPIAMKMLLEGAALSAVEALAMGLIEAVVDADLLARACALATDMANNPLVRTADRRDGLRDPLAYQSAIAEARKRVEGARLPAPQVMVDCVEAALLLPFETGLAFEQSHAETMADTPEAAGLRHAFLAEKRAVMPPPDLARTAPPRLTSIMVLGSAGLAPDVARMALSAGMKVRLVAADRTTLAEALQRIAARQEALVAEGQLGPAAREADWARGFGAAPGSDYRRSGATCHWSECAAGPAIGGFGLWASFGMEGHGAGRRRGD